MNVVGFIRVSTQGQAKDGYSLKYQEDEIKEYCEEQGLNLKHILRDEGISGTKLNEEALKIKIIQGGLTGDVGIPFVCPNTLCGCTEHKQIMEVGYCEGADSTRVEEIWL